MPLWAALTSGGRVAAVGAAIGALAGGAVVWWVQDRGHTAEIAELRADRAVEQAAAAKQLRAVSEAAAKDAAAALKRQKVLQASLAAADALHTKALAEKEAENEKLRTDVAAGARRLRVAATCSAAEPGDAQGMSRTPAAAGVGNAAGPRLTDAAERNYFILIDRIAKMTAQVEALQSYARQAQAAGED